MILHAVDPEMLPALLNCFCRCAVATRFLSPGQLMEALSAPGLADLFVAGTLDSGSRTMTLWRGDMSPLTIPLSYFRPSGVGTRADFARFSIEDYGRTVRLGDYEAAAEAILYEFDSGYRRRLKRERAATERSFGASLRRLRKQRELSREDFAPDICARTIARIERGKVQRIQAATLKAIATRLNVLPEEIETF